MPFHDAAAIIVLQDRRHRLHGLKKEIHADGEIRSVQHRAFAVRPQLTNSIKMVIPAGGAHYDRNSGLDTADHIWNHGMRGSEIDDGINAFERCRRESTAIL